MGKCKLSSGHFRERLRIGGVTICLAKVKVGMEVSSAFQRDMATVLVKVTGTAPPVCLAWYHVQLPPRVGSSLMTQQLSQLGCTEHQAHHSL